MEAVYLHNNFNNLISYIFYISWHEGNESRPKLAHSLLRWWRQLAWVSPLIRRRRLTIFQVLLFHIHTNGHSWCVYDLPCPQSLLAVGVLIWKILWNERKCDCHLEARRFVFCNVEMEARWVFSAMSDYYIKGKYTCTGRCCAIFVRP